MVIYHFMVIYLSCLYIFIASKYKSIQCLAHVNLVLTGPHIVQLPQLLHQPQHHQVPHRNPRVVSKIILKECVTVYFDQEQRLIGYYLL